MGSAHTLPFLLLVVLSLSAASTDQHNRNSTNWIRLANPEDVLLTTYYGSPSNSLSVLIYVDKDITDFDIFIESSMPSVATVSDDVLISSCEQISWNSTIERPNSTNDIEYEGLQDTETCYNLSFTSTAVYIGYSNLKFYSQSNETTDDEYLGVVLLRAIRPHRPVDTAYNLSIMILVTIVMLATGNDLEFETIKEHLKKPKAPIVAVLAQFTIMPLISYAVIWIFGYTGGKALGFFAMGCSPGGGTSNMYSRLFDGDMSLSVTMTTLGTVASIGMLPLWLYTLGETIPADEGVEKVQIPFLNILQSLAFIVVPLGIGALMKYKLPRVALAIKKWLNVMFLLALIFFLVFLIYVKFYVFVKWDMELTIAACALPYGGYLLGGLVAWICRFDWRLIKTIAIETGMQSIAVSALVIMSVSNQPDNDLALTLPIASTVVAGWPFFIILPIYVLRQKLKERKKAKSEKNITDSESSISDESMETIACEKQRLELDSLDEPTANNEFEKRELPSVEMKLLNR
ncbi:ileal sodium/bile acid cotransporter-like [Watersipora subatra]|uniref:ileal sodium/bile acid cotransporter-like n=1 Tax=Watersipora subatra TaxID=2589382 RepID=UPI00355C2A14